MCQIGVMKGYRLDSTKFELLYVSDWCVMTGYKLDSIKFELPYVSDWCDDWLQAGQCKVRTAICVRLV